MRDHGKQPGSDESALRRAVRHPKRLEMLGYLAGKKRTGLDEVELAEALGSSLALTKYHLKVLRSAGLVAHAGGVGPGMTDRYVAATAEQ